ncbi:MAG: hypothetical protein HC897_03860 [Thermoanaerobaculia bacterium]|nr:hypothetical protein [Thermoanaerobaculia bacterium]
MYLAKLVVLFHIGEPTELRPKGKTGTGFGCSGNDINTTLDDEAASPVESQCAAGVPTILGTFSANNTLAAFIGQDLSGTWRITASDNASSDLGTLTEWCLAPASNFATPIFLDGFESGNTGAWTATLPSDLSR